MYMCVSPLDIIKPSNSFINSFLLNLVRTASPLPTWKLPFKLWPWATSDTMLRLNSTSRPVLDSRNQRFVTKSHCSTCQSQPTTLSRCSGVRIVDFGLIRPFSRRNSTFCRPSFWSIKIVHFWSNLLIHGRIWVCKMTKLILKFVRA